MPELPEVETVCRTLRPHLIGKTISSFSLHWLRTLEQPCLDEFICSIVGQTITNVTRRAKLILLLLNSGGAISVHLRMTGELLYRSDSGTQRDSAREPYLRAVFEFTDRSDLLFYDTRKFGKIAYRTPEELVMFGNRYGVEPLEPEFTVARLTDLLHGRRRQIKPLLLDQGIIAGLGNIYVDESLFRAGIHPLQPSSDIDAERIAALHSAIVDVLLTAVALQGTTFRDYRSGLGETGTNQSRLRVYGLKPGSPCPTCGTPVERLVVGQRGSIFCPNCQRLTPVR